MNVVDSSGWLEYFADGPNAAAFARPLQDTEALLVPVICIYEVFKRIYQQRDESSALAAMAVMQHGTQVPVDPSLAVRAAKLAADSALAMADSLILATAQLHNATLWTQDSDFEGLAGVHYIPKKTGPRS